MGEQGNKSHEELLKEQGMFILGKARWHMTAPVLRKGGVFYVDPDRRTQLAGALQQVPYSLYQRSSLSPGLWTTIKDIGEGTPALKRGACGMRRPD